MDTIRKTVKLSKPFWRRYKKYLKKRNLNYSTGARLAFEEQMKKDK